MHEAIKTAVDEAFAGYLENSALDGIKAEIAVALEERMDEARRRGVVEEAALKKTLGDFSKILKSAASHDKKKRLALIAKALELSPLGRIQSLGRILSSLLGLAGIMAVLTVNVTIGGPHRALPAGTPFFILCAAAFTFLHLTRYRVDRQPKPRQTALLLALLAATLTGTILTTAILLLQYTRL